MNTAEIDRILQVMLSYREKVSDLHFYVNRPPQVEVDGSLYSVTIPGLERLTPFQLDVIARTVLSSSGDALKRFDKSGAADFSYSISGVCRFRVNVYRQRGTLSMVMRVIPFDVPTIKDLQLPEVLYSIVQENNGIVLVTGPTGSGKSTTIAAIIEEINNKRACHVVTIEDPIEYLYRHKTASICQRELGADTTSFAAALRDALRQAPKVIVVGEMRDAETAEIALEAAETGHLVFSTLHTIDAAKAIDRILGIFPKSEEDQIRNRFAQSFRFVIAQRLIPKKGGGRLLAMEILKSNARTREYIIKGEGENRSLLDAMNDGYLEGMQTFDGVLENMVKSGVLDKETALRHATNPNNLALSLQGSVSELEDQISWQELVAKETLDVHDIYKLPHVIADIQAEAPAQVEPLVQHLLECLQGEENRKRIAVLSTLAPILETLSQDLHGTLQETALQTLNSSVAQESAEEVLLAYVGYYQAAFVASLRHRDYSFCSLVLASVVPLLDQDVGHQRHFASGIENAEMLLCSEIASGKEGADVATEYLRLCGEKGAEFFFRWLVEEEKRPTRIQILNYIGKLDPQHLSLQVEKRLDDYRWYVVRNMITVLTKQDVPETSRFLQQVADHEDVRVAKEVLKKLYQSLSTEDSSLVLRYLQHKDKSIRIQATNLVSMSGITTATPYLLRMLASTTEQDTDLRAACFVALTRLRVKEALPPAQKTLERKPASRNELAERNAAVKLLGELGLEGYSSVLRKVASSDSFKETRDAASAYVG